MCVCVCVCVCRGIYLLISVAEIRYRHDLIRLCHKFYFCPFQMKIPRGKRAVCFTCPGLCLGFFVWEGVHPKQFLEPRNAEKIFFRACRGSGGMLARKILKR